MGSQKAHADRAGAKRESAQPLSNALNTSIRSRITISGGKGRRVTVKPVILVAKLKQDLRTRLHKRLDEWFLE